MLHLIKHFLKHNPGATIHQLAELCDHDYQLATMLIQHWQNIGKIKHTNRKLTKKCKTICGDCSPFSVDEYHWVEQI